MRRVSWLTARQRHFSLCWSCCATILAFASKKQPMFAAVASLTSWQLSPVPEQSIACAAGVPGPCRPTAGGIKLDPKTRKTLLLDFVRTLPRSGSGDTTIVIIEDLHWIDAASEEFVEALADAVVGTRPSWFVNFRPGFTAPLMQRSHYRQINMPPLAAGTGGPLLQDHFGNDPSLALLSRNIIERAQGNPFFLEELVNALVERGDFEGEKGAYRLKGGIDSIPLPSTVQAVVAARIDRLEENARRVLESRFSSRSRDFDHRFWMRSPV